MISSSYIVAYLLCFLPTGCHQLIASSISALLHHCAGHAAVLHMHRLPELLSHQPASRSVALCLHHASHEGRSTSWLLAVALLRSHGSHTAAIVHSYHRADTICARLSAQYLPQQPRTQFPGTIC